MGIIKAYLIYQYGRKKGEREYAEVVQYAHFKEKDRERNKEREKQEYSKCPDCGWERFRHGPEAECPEYS
jgi:hypothetical protein